MTSDGADALRPLAALLSMERRVAVVTGAARGIGAAVAARLAEAGAAVLVADVDGPGAQATAREIEGRHGGRAVPCTLDVADTAAVAEAAARADRELGGLHIWVNNAGIFPPTGPLLETPDDLFDRIALVNTRGTLAGAREAARRMTGGGVIVNVASTTAIKTVPGAGAYAASKSAVLSLTRCLAVELAPRGIRVLAVAPGIVETPGMRAQLDAYADRSIDLAALLHANPLGRPASPDDVARVVLFCASELAAHLTGTVIPVDGGSTA